MALINWFLVPGPPALQQCLLNIQSLASGLPALLRKSQEWCLVHPPYRLPTLQWMDPVALPQMIWLPLNYRFPDPGVPALMLDPSVPALLLMGQGCCLAHSLYTLSLVNLLPLVAAAQLLLIAPMAVPHTRLPLIFRPLNPAVPALLPTTRVSPEMTAPPIRTAPMALPQSIWLPTQFRFLVTGVPALLQPGQEWYLVHPRYMPPPGIDLPRKVTVPSHPGVGPVGA